ncbi:MAG: hypothetical protein GF355_14565 [Candidatus Eisenbacteria bacterium]|nr:hypothetical protein [Candidatus Eisenbacteria bacterium]
MSRQWDTFVSGAIYLQAVEGMRRDVAIVDPELLRRTWYIPQLERWYPGLLDPVRRELGVFLPELERFEKGRPYDPMRIERAYQTLKRALLREHAARRPVAITPEVGPEIIEQRLYPHGLALVAGVRDPVAAGIRDPVAAGVRDTLLTGRGPLPPVQPFLEDGPRTDTEMARLMRRLFASMARARADLLRLNEEPGAEELLRDARRLAERNRPETGP